MSVLDCKFLVCYVQHLLYHRLALEDNRSDLKVCLKICNGLNIICAKSKKIALGTKVPDIVGLE